MYRAPLTDLSFVLNVLLGPDPLSGCPTHAEYSADLAESVLSESARFAEGVLDPINHSGDQEGAHWSEDGVRSATGFREAYQQFVAGGWQQLRAPAHLGGQGAPMLLATAAGLGIGVLPEFLCRQGLATGRLKLLLPDWELPQIMPLYAVYPATQGADTRVQRFVDFLAANVVPALAQI